MLLNELASYKSMLLCYVIQKQNINLILKVQIGE